MAGWDSLVEELKEWERTWHQRPLPDVEQKFGVQEKGHIEKNE
jgi:hypothetical protein